MCPRSCIVLSLSLVASHSLAVYLHAAATAAHIVVHIQLFDTTHVSFTAEASLV